ncbi:hypothetical protein DYQ86_07215 [Acidobacteria bacterium AB60]|nr:hypothetical protein DYQ86_07215 [Acidobacteria bacterium AB60]
MLITFANAPQQSNRNPPKGWIARLLLWIKSKVGLDRAIAFTVLARTWTAAAGLVTVGLIARFLSQKEQGYYYTFGSLIALQIVFELGFSFVILQMASHERAHLVLHKNGSVSGDSTAHARLASVLQKSVRWYSAAAIFLAIFLLAAGSYFFSAHQQSGNEVHWRLSWIAAAISASLTFQLDPVLSFMEGCGFVANVARLRLVQAIAGSTLAWASLLLRHGLLAPAMVMSGNATVAALWLWRYRRFLIGLLRHAPTVSRIHWMREVWPFQWRIAISWLCGYFIYQLFNPVLFAYRGPVVAGQMGMSLSLINAMKSISMSWISTKSAPFGSFIARKEYALLDSAFFRALVQSLLVCLAGASFIYAGSLFLNWRHIAFAHRLLSPNLLGLLLLVAVIDTAVFAQALYLRAHKREKFLRISILNAVLMAASTLICGKYVGVNGIVIGALAIGVLSGLPLGTYTFLKYRRVWHAY